LKLINKHSQLLLLAAGIVFLFQFSIIPLLHNHPADIQEHYDCPAFILTVTLVSFFSSIIICFNLNIPFLKRIVFSNSFEAIPSPTTFRIKNKAPPF